MKYGHSLLRCGFEWLSVYYILRIEDILTNRVVCFYRFVILAFDSLGRLFECVLVFCVCVCVCFVYIAVQLTHNFKPTYIFLFCIKKYAEVITISRHFCLFYNSEYVVTEEEQDYGKMIKRVDISSAKMYMYKRSFIHDSDQMCSVDAHTFSMRQQSC